MNKHLTREEHIVRAVKLAKQSTFGVTGLKIELEARFNRNETHAVQVACTDMCRDGFITCADCQGDGCEHCSHDGRYPHPECFFETENWRNNFFCQQWLLRELVPHGLAKYDEQEHCYQVDGPMVYCQFYTDPSVDAEFTFTLSLDDPQAIFKTPEVIRAWNRLGEAIGQGVDVQNAGMHMAFLNHPKCYYSGGDYIDDTRQRQCLNFEKAMRLLMPALFFLGSANNHSRSLHFRQPQVSYEKYSAIHYVGGALEFRVFETCYEEPDRVLDNFMVMRNCLRFWQNSYRSPKLERIIREIHFGNDNGETVDRFYRTASHLDILNAGLRKLKPAYLKVSELKAQRGFKTTKKHIDKELITVKEQATIGYKEYTDRFNWRLEVDRSQHTTYFMSNYPAPKDKAERAKILTEVRKRVKQQLERTERERLTVAAYVQEQVNNHTKTIRGAYRLTAA